MTGFARRQEQIVEVDVGTEELCVTAGIAAVEVHERGVETDRRHGQQLLAIGVGRTHGPKQRIDVGDARPEAGACWQKRQPQ